MKKIILTLAGILTFSFVFSQTQVINPLFTNKIVLTNEQTILVQTNLSLESSFSQGMEMTNKSITAHQLVVKSINDNKYTISSTMTKVKMEIDMMGQTNNFDSDKKEDMESETGKLFMESINKPEDVIIENNTGRDVTAKKKEKKRDVNEDNPTQGFLNIFEQKTGNTAVTGAFELIPAGKNVGDSWLDSTNEKDLKSIRTYTLKSLTDKEAVLQLNEIIDATNTIDFQGMSMEFNSNTKTATEIITDITTGLVKKRTSQSEVNGSMQLMGQDVPISAKISSVSSYQ